MTGERESCSLAGILAASARSMQKRSKERVPVGLDLISYEVIDGHNLISPTCLWIPF